MSDTEKDMLIEGLFNQSVRIGELEELVDALVDDRAEQRRQKREMFRNLSCVIRGLGDERDKLREVINIAPKVAIEAVKLLFEATGKRQ